MEANAVQYLMPIYTTVVGLVIGFLFGKVRELARKKADSKSEEAKTLALLKDGMAMLLREQIERFYQEYKDADAIPPDRWEYFMKVDTTYTGLGGNGTVAKIREILSKKKLL